MTPLPSLDRTSPTFRSDLDAFFLTKIPTFVTEANALQVDVTAKASATTTAVNFAMAAGLANAATNVASAAADRTQTSLDRVATGQDRTQTGLDRAAVAVALEAVSGGPVISIQNKTGIVNLTPTEIAPAATVSEMTAGTQVAYRSMSPKLVADAVTAKSAATGDLLITLRNPGSGWITAGAVYLQSAYTALFAQIGIITDYDYGANYQAAAGSLGTFARTYTRFSSTVLYVVAAATNPGNGAQESMVKKTINNGVSWTNQGAQNSLNSATRKIIALSETRLLALQDNLVKLSTDSGATWTTAYTGPANGAYLSQLVALTASVVLFTSYDTGSGNAFFMRSTDGGSTFVSVPAIVAMFVQNTPYSLVRLSDTTAAALGPNSRMIYITAGGTAAVLAPTDWWPDTVLGDSCKMVLVATDKVIVANNGRVRFYKPSDNTWYSGTAITVESGGGGSLYPVKSDLLLYLSNGSNLGSDYRNPWRYSHDGGSTWTSAPLGIPAQGPGAFHATGTTEDDILFLPQINAGGTVQMVKRYDYDPATQFRASSVAGIVGAKAWIKV